MTTRFWDIQITLNSGYTEYERQTATVTSRIICNFIERAIYRLNHRCEFSRLVIECSKSEKQEEFRQVKDPRMAFVYVQNDISGFDENNEKKLSAFETLIRQGFEAASKYSDLPTSDVFNALDEFKKRGSQNKWIHAKKTWKRKQLNCLIECNHKIDVFELTQKIYKNGQLIQDAIIAKEMPREMLYQQYLGKLTLTASDNVVYAAKGKVISTYNVVENILEINFSV